MWYYEKYYVFQVKTKKMHDFRSELKQKLVNRIFCVPLPSLWRIAGDYWNFFSYQTWYRCVDFRNMVPTVLTGIDLDVSSSSYEFSRKRVQNCQSCARMNELANQGTNVKAKINIEGRNLKIIYIMTKKKIILL